MTNSNDALRACPFCGERDVEPYRRPLSIVWHVYCTACEIHGHGEPTEAEAIAAWNRRPSPVAGGDLREALGLWLAYDAGNWNDNTTAMLAAYDKALTATRAALNQPSAPVEAVEPVAWMHRKGNDRELEWHNHGAGMLTDADKAAGWAETPLYAHPPEPAASTVAQGEG